MLHGLTVRDYYRSRTHTYSILRGPITGNFIVVRVCYDGSMIPVERFATREAAETFLRGLRGQS
jgi:hypothetical protein